MRYKTKEEIIEALKKRTLIYYKDELHRVQFDLFGAVVVIGLSKAGDIQTLTPDMIDDCFSHFKNS